MSRSLTIDPNGADLAPIAFKARALRLAPPNPDLPPDRTGLREEAEALLDHPDFDAAMRAFCRNLANFHTVEFSRRTGVVDTVTFAIAVLIIHLDRASPHGANASLLVGICLQGRLAGAAAARNAIDSLRHFGMVEAHEDAPIGRPHRLRPTPALIDTMQENLAVRLTAMEPVVAWPRPAAAWARTDGVLAAFVGRNFAAYQGDGFKLYNDFPEVQAFMDRHCGYILLLEALGRIAASPEGAAATLPLSEIADKFAVSRAHIRKLFRAAAARGWLAFESGGRLTIGPLLYGRLRLWIGYEFAWTRRLVAPQ